MSLCIIFTLMFFLTTTHWSTNVIPLFKDGSEINNFLLVDTEGCKIPKLDLFDSSIYWYLTRGSELNLDLSTANMTLYGDHQMKKKTHDFFIFINESKPFTTNVTINNEFIRVRCFDNNNALLHTNVFSFVHIKPDVEKRCADNYRKQQNNDHLSIKMVGVDSVSRNNMIRYMPKTRDYLLNI